MPSYSARRAHRPTVLAVLATTSVILPAFLTGAMAVQISAGLGLGEADIGLAIGVFFGGSAAGSVVLGRLAEALGPLPAIRLGLVSSMAADLAIVVFVDDARSLQLLLVAAGLANALSQPAVNLLLVRLVEPDRLGLAMALKQSGMPAAALLGGLAVPAVALTVGWRAAYLLAATLAVIGVALSFDPAAGAPGAEDADGARTKAGPGWRPGGRATPADRVDRTDTPTVGRPDQRWAILGLMAAVGVLGGGAANIIVGYLVSGAVAAGIEPGPAGLLLTVGSALGIVARLANGRLVDGGRIQPLRTVVALFALGSAGALVLALQTPAAYLIGTPVAFAAGWAWPGLFNLVVVQANRSAPAAATGVTQTGVYLGSLASPILAGVLIERSGYRAAWLLTAAALAGACGLAALVRTGMRHSNHTASDRGRTAGATTRS